MSETNFVRIGSIDRKTGVFSPKKDYKAIFEGLNIEVPTQRVIDYLDGRLNWMIIGNLPDQPEGSNGIFLNKSKSGKSLVFFVQDVCYIVPIKAYTEFASQYIGVFTVED